MRIEHLAYQVSRPAEMADWYCAHMGFAIKRAGNGPIPFRFVADSSGRVMIELYHNPAVAVPDHAAIDPVQHHLAFACDDVPGTAERLVRAGATLVSSPNTAESGDTFAMLRDPWGLAIQLCKRRERMV